jgi:ribonuclease HI
MIIMAKAKFYGVKAGRKIGVFTTWAECEEQIKGFSGAQYQGFTSEELATEYVYGVPESKEPEVSKKDNVVIIYTDGACENNPGKGGWGTILMYNGHKKEMSGAEHLTTNNKMEMQAAIQGLQALNRPCIVELYSDSAYLINGMNNWMRNWKRNGWETKDGEEVKNIDEWQELDSLNSIHKVTWIKVKGHSDNEYNNRCDQLAVQARRNIR